MPASIQDTARRTYHEGMRELVSGNYVRAAQHFNQVARNPRNMRYAALARLRIADSLLLQDRHEDAVEVYQAFINQYESDPNIDYARYRIADAYHRRLPTDWFASPAASEIDQTMTYEAVRKLVGFLDTFPASRFADRAREMLAEARGMLFAHESYAADFYERRDKWRATAWRLAHIVKTYPEFGKNAETVWRMAEMYARAGDKADALVSYALYVREFPDGKKRAAAEGHVARLTKELREAEDAKGADDEQDDAASPEAAGEES